jgi:hypothetical protein
LASYIAKPSVNHIVKHVSDPIIGPIVGPVVKRVADPIVGSVVKRVADPIIADPIRKTSAADLSAISPVTRLFNKPGRVNSTVEELLTQKSDLPNGFQITETVVVNGEPYVLRMMDKNGRKFVAYVDDIDALDNYPHTRTYLPDFDNEDMDDVHAHGVLDCLNMDVSGVSVEFTNASNFDIVGRYDDIETVSLVANDAEENASFSMFLYPVVKLSEIVDYPDQIYGVIGDASTQIMNIMRSRDAETMRGIQATISSVHDKYDKYVSLYNETFEGAVESLRQTATSSLTLRRRYEILEHIIYQNRFIDSELGNLAAIDGLLDKSTTILEKSVKPSIRRKYAF